MVMDSLLGMSTGSASSAALAVGIMLAAGAVLGGVANLALSLFGIRGASRKNGEV